MKNWKLKREQGFTLMELTVTVAIIVALVAVGTNVAFDLNVKYKQKNIDSYAENIYMAAQNRLLELKANGMSECYDTKIGEGGSSKQVGEDVPVQPYGRTEEGDLRYVTSSTGQDILPEGSIESTLRNGNWVIEYSPESASVYGVFYVDEEADSSVYNYTLYPNLFNDLRDRRERLKNGAMVGYWGGVNGDISVDEVKNTPTITVKNGDELTLEVSCLGNYGDKPVFCVKLHGIASGKDVEIEVPAEEYDGVKEEGGEGTYTACLTLDSLEKPFAENTDYMGLYHGENITATVSVESDNPNYAYSKATTEEFNTLFGKTNRKDKKTFNSVSVSCQRHFRNLPDLDSKLEIVTVKQTADLDVGGISIRSIPEGTKIGTYNGANHTLSNLKTETGLFEKLEDGMTVKNLTVEKANVTGSQNAGVVAGEVSGSKVTISDIEVIDATVSATSGNAGALVGLFSGENGKIQNCTVRLEEQKTEGLTQHITGGNVGGLVGQCTGSGKISKSYAAVVSGATDSAGGLVGQNTGSVQVTQSYADCYLYGKTTGGLVGAGSGTVNLSDCYAAGYQTATGTAAGLVAGNLSSAENVYTISEMKGETVYSTAMAKTEEAEEELYSSLYYRVPGQDILGELIQNKLSFISAFDEMSAFSGSTTENHAYNLDGGERKGYDFPVLTCFGENYGDWYGKIHEKTGGLYYFEKYDDNGTDKSFGVWGLDKAALRDENGLSVCDDGYAVKMEDGITFTDISETTWTYNQGGVSGFYGDTYVWSDGKSIAKRDTYQFTVDGVTYCTIPKEITHVGYKDQNSFYQTVKVNDEVCYYNPYFAKSIASEDNTQKLKTVYVRSPRHLNAMAQYHDDWFTNWATDTVTFEQELDLDFSRYSLSDSQTPIGVGSEFKAIYDGNGNKIENVTFAVNGNYLGLFGVNAGTIQNVVMENDTCKGTTPYMEKTELYVGLLAGINGGTITECRISGCTVTPTNRGTMTQSAEKFYVGGITGLNQSTISAVSCEGESKIDISAELFKTYNNKQVFVGSAVGSNSKSGSLTGFDNWNAWTVSASNGEGTDLWAGGFVGYNEGTIKTVSMNGNEKAVTFSGGDFGCENLYAGVLAGGNAGTIQECSVKNYTFSAANKGGQGNLWAGTLVGWNKGVNSKILDSTIVGEGKTFTFTAEGNGSASSYFGGLYIGGMIGQNQGSVENSAVSGYNMKVTASYCDGVNGDNFVGGLVGRNDSGATITGSATVLPSCQNTSTYTAVEVGGFAGYNNGTIESGYVLTSLVNTNNGRSLGVLDSDYKQNTVGGFTAVNANAGTVSNSYSAVALTSSGRKVAIDAFGSGSTVSNCYYLREAKYTTDWQGKKWNWYRTVTVYPFEFNGSTVYYETESNLNGATPLNYATLSDIDQMRGSTYKLTDFGRADGYGLPAIIKNDVSFVHYGLQPIKKPATEVTEKSTDYRKPDN